MCSLGCICFSTILLSEKDNQEYLVGRLAHPYNICEVLETFIPDPRLEDEQVFGIIASAIVTAYILAGGAKHTSDISLAQLPRITKLNYLSQVFNILGFSTGKISVAFLIYRLQSPSRWRTWLLAILSILSFVLAILVIALFYAQCTPVRAIWIPSAGTCWNPKYVNDWDITASSKSPADDTIRALS